MRKSYKLTSFKTTADPRATPATIQFEDLYRRRGVYPGWRNEHVGQLLKRLGCSIQELLAMCAEFDFNIAKHSAERDRWPPSLSLHFALIEAALDSRTEKRGRGRSRIVRPEILTYGSPPHS